MVVTPEHAILIRILTIAAVLTFTRLRKHAERKERKGDSACFAFFDTEAAE
jgi:hypothetical protein